MGIKNKFWELGKRVLMIDGYMITMYTIHVITVLGGGKPFTWSPSEPPNWSPGTRLPDHGQA